MSTPSGAGAAHERTDADRWTTCAQGHRHWGAHGAAGLLAVGSDAVLLQLRAGWSHHGGTWGLLGGARRRDEDARIAARREALEESSLSAEDVDDERVHTVVVDDHDGWSYSTCIAALAGRVDVEARGAESEQVRWVGVDDVERLDLHPGLRDTWPALRALLREPVVVVDVANVMGSTPDGWWRDRAGAAGRLLAALASAVADGTLGALAAGPPAGGLHVRRRAAVVAVLEGAARAAARPAPSHRLRVVAAPASGDDAIVAEVAARRSDAAVTVVSADRGLGARARAEGAAVVGPRALLDVLGR